MKIELTKDCCEQIARQVAQFMRQGEVKQPAEKEEYVSTREAATILRVSTDRMRHLKDKFPHIKVGGSDQGKLLFLKSALLSSYAAK